MENVNTFLANFSATAMFDNVKELRETVNGKHDLTSAKSVLSKQGNNMVTIDLTHSRESEYGIIDYLRTGSASDWKQSFNRVKYLLQAIGCGAEHLANVPLPFEAICETADGTACTPETEGANMVVVINYNKESMLPYNAKHGEDVQILKSDSPKTLSPTNNGLDANGLPIERAGHLVRFTSAKTKAYCDAIALVLTQFVGKTVELEITLNDNKFQKVSRYKTVK